MPIFPPGNQSSGFSGALYRFSTEESAVLEPNTPLEILAATETPTPRLLILRNLGQTEIFLTFTNEAIIDSTIKIPPGFAFEIQDGGEKISAISSQSTPISWIVRQERQPESPIYPLEVSVIDLTEYGWTKSCDSGHVLEALETSTVSNDTIFVECPEFISGDTIEIRSINDPTFVNLLSDYSIIHQDTNGSFSFNWDLTYKYLQIVLIEPFGSAKYFCKTWNAQTKTVTLTNGQWGMS